MRSQYAPPANYGVPNPWGPRTHNWKGGSLNEGSLFHGPIYTRPVFGLPRISNPIGIPYVDGLGFAVSQETMDKVWWNGMKLLGGFALVFVLEHYALDMILGKKR